MTNRLINARCGLWKCEREMGSGGFGSVTSWINQSNGDKMVIKQCKNTLNEKNRARWLEEIHLMNAIHHENVVSGRTMPEEIEKFINAPEKLLGLEFCDSDLRKMLGNRAHCCGLQEQTVISILQDVSCGLAFLHKQKIIHRDLKPENILLSYKDGTTVPVFKITDLGYAKVMDASSIAMSFVGTIQYLAPELFDIKSAGYTYTADFWSLGTLIFECITGNRPFGLTIKAYDWAKLMFEKDDDQIWGDYDQETNSVKFYKEISIPNHLCKPLLDAFCNWFKLVLRISADRRGKSKIKLNNGIEVSECFFGIQQILEKKIINIFDVLKCQKYSYEFQPDIDTGYSLKMFIQNEMGVDTQDQTIIIADRDSFQTLDDEKLLVNQCKRNVQEVIFFNTKPGPNYNNIERPMPDKVRELVGNSTDKKKYTELRPLWAHALFYCQTKANEYALLLKSRTALTKIIQTKWVILQLEKADLEREITKLTSFVEMFSLSYNYDLMNRPEDYEGGHDCMNEWQRLKKKVDDFTSYKNMDKLNETLVSIGEMIKRLESNHYNPLDDEVNKAGERYDKLRERIHDTKSRDNSHDSVNISNIVMGCMESAEGLHRHFYAELKGSKGLLNLIKEITFVSAEIKCRIKDIAQDIQKVKEHQKVRQRITWRLLVSQNPDDNPSFSSLRNVLQDKLTKSLTTNETTAPIVADEINKDFDSAFKMLDRALSNERPARMSPRKCQTFDIPSTSSELTTDKTNPDYIRRKSMPADMHHREGESSQSNMVGTAVGAAPLFYKRSELIKDVHDDDDQLSVEIPFDFPPVVADPGIPRLVTPATNNGSTQQQQQQQQQQHQHQHQYPTPNKVSPPKTESLINHQRIQGHAPYYSNNPNAASHHHLTKQQQQQPNLSLFHNQYSHHHNTSPISLPVTAADINHHRPTQPQPISIQRQTTLNVTQAQLPATAIPSPRSSPTPPHMRTTRQQQQPTVPHIQQFSFGPSTGKQHKGSHAIGGGNTSQRK